MPSSKVSTYSINGSLDLEHADRASTGSHEPVIPCVVKEGLLFWVSSQISPITLKFRYTIDAFSFSCPSWALEHRILPQTRSYQPLYTAIQFLPFQP